MMRFLLTLILFIAISGALGALLALPTMWLWNYLLPALFGFKCITFGQAFAINVLTALLFKSSHSSSKQLGETMKLLSTVKNSLAALRGLISRKSAPAAMPITPTIERKETPAPVEAPAVVGERGINIPRLAIAILTKQMGKRHAFRLAKAYYGEDGARDLADAIEDARKKWLPKPGQVRISTDNTVYEVDKNGAYRKRPDMVVMRNDRKAQNAAIPRKNAKTQMPAEVLAAMEARA